MSTETRLRDLEAHEQIRRLAADYCHGIDKHDFERFASIWADDARWFALPDGDWSIGRPAIVERARGLASSVTSSCHWTANHSVRVTGNSAVGLADADCVASTPDGQWFRIAVSYDDLYECRGDRWVLTQRQTTIHHYLPIANPARDA